MLDLLADGQGGFDGPVQVEFTPEDRHDRVPDEFVHIALVGNDLLHQGVKIGVEQVNDQVGPAVFADLGKPAQVHEHHRGLDIFAGGNAGFVFLPAHEIQHILVHVHPEDIVLLDRTQGIPDLADVLQGLFHGNGQVLEIDGLGNEVEGPPVHGRAYIFHIPVGGDDDRLEQRVLLIEFPEQGKPVHLRHVDIAEHQIRIGFLIQLFERFLPVIGKEEFVLLVPDLFPELLLDQNLEVRFIVHYQYLGHQFNVVNFSFNSEKSSGLVRKSSAPSRWAFSLFCWSP